jgi:hypothetical protein
VIDFDDLVGRGNCTPRRRDKDKDKDKQQARVGVTKMTINYPRCRPI